MRGEIKVRGYTVGQFPNTPLWIALAGFLIAVVFGEGSVGNAVGRGVGYVALTVWAYEEAARGVNGFRRAIGVVALALIALALARAFH